MKNRVQIGTCSGPAEAAFVRSVFDAHDLPVIINGEMHASAMGGLAGFVPLNILVDEDDAEDAAALLRDIRQGEHAVSDGDEPPDDEHAASREEAPPEAPDSDELADAAGVWDSRGDATAAKPPPAGSGFTPTTGFDTRRRRTGVVLLLAVVLGFGSAHMSTGAWGRGIAIAAFNVAGFGYAVSGDFRLGGWLLFAARFADLFGALWRVWSQPGHGRSGGTP
jgi:hypothetical protein